MRVSLLMGLIFGLCACDASNETERILQERDLAATQIIDIQTTSTVQGARIQTTLDYSGTQVSMLDSQSQFLKATLVSQGIPLDAIEALQRSMVQSVSLPSPTPAEENTLQATNDPLNPIITPFSPVVVAPPPTQNSIPQNSTNARLENAVTSLGVGEDDCAIDTTNRFNTSTTAIYIVATALNIPPNTRLSSRWFFGNELKATFDFTPDFAIQGACIWFFADSTDFAFETGTWSVTLDINEVPATQPIPFTIDS